MAEYNVSTGALCEAGDCFSALAAELDSAHERLDAVLAALPENLLDLRKHLAGAGDSVSEASKKARGFGRALWEISEIYSRAEGAAFAERNEGAGAQTEDMRSNTPPPIRTPSGVSLFGDLIMPEWLQVAVMKYAQSQGKA